jgi:Asp-tRNA(Asn)/Glu-tRNA(Gln) amidotransferase B subunit
MRKMSEDRLRVLRMLAEGKISAEEAESLLDALAARHNAAAEPSEAGSAIKGDPTPLLSALPKYLYVKVDSVDGDKVDVKVPLALVRSGLKLTSLIPPQAMDKIDEQLSENGISIDFSNLKPEDIEELISALREMEINVDSANGDKVRVYTA